DITLHGSGGHGSRPETTVDPVYLAANVVTRLQGIVAREVAPAESAVVTVGQLHAGTKNNIIPPSARLGLSVRTFDDAVREKVITAIERVTRAEAQASGAPKAPEFDYLERFPLTVNDPAATARTLEALRKELGQGRVLDPGAIAGSEDVGVLATAAGAPLVYWFLGGFDPERFADMLETGRMPEDLPSNHSPHFAPLIEPTLSTGVRTLVAAAREWLD
ncbi:MAG: peptidase dimerization domain-containing protein, partial [Actinomycetota bacterium]|nr:peptidase dimerization domain-containing protein [Actinomycetota bacterium]